MVVTVLRGKRLKVEYGLGQSVTEKTKRSGLTTALVKTAGNRACPTLSLFPCWDHGLVHTSEKIISSIQGNPGETWAG
jgi:hypothetical protein